MRPKNFNRAPSLRSHEPKKKSSEMQVRKLLAALAIMGVGGAAAVEVDIPSVRLWGFLAAVAGGLYMFASASMRGEAAYERNREIEKARYLKALMTE